MCPVPDCSIVDRLALVILSAFRWLNLFFQPVIEMTHHITLVYMYLGATAVALHIEEGEPGNNLL